MKNLLLFCIFVPVAGLVSAAPSSTGRSDLRVVLADAMKGRSGTAVVLDFRTNRILGAYRLHDAAIRLSTPGSTVKPIVLRALLESGKLQSNTTFVCPRVLNIHGVRADCTHPISEQTLDAKDALVWSCNGYFARAATHFAEGELESLYQASGLTSPTRLIADESSGTVQRARTIEERQLLAIGAQGVLVTPLELLESYRKLVQQITAPNASVASQLVRTALEESVERGMAHTAADSNIEIAGKTGTAVDPGQVLTHGWFVGYAPASDPQVMIVVKVENARGADAAQIAGRILHGYAGAKQ